MTLSQVIQTRDVMMIVCKCLLVCAMYGPLKIGANNCPIKETLSKNYTGSLVMCKQNKRNAIGLRVTNEVPRSCLLTGHAHARLACQKASSTFFMR